MVGFDRDLGVAGRVMVRDSNGSIVQKLVKVDRPSMCYQSRHWALANLWQFFVFPLWLFISTARRISLSTRRLSCSPLLA